MDKIINIPNVRDYDEYWGVPSRHPHINIVDGSLLADPVANCRKNVGMYVIFLKDVLCADYITYGRKEYDFQKNTLVFIGPGQVFGHPCDGSAYQPKGWCLYFSPDLLHGTPLSDRMKDFSYFSYAANEALHVSEKERNAVIDCFRKIDYELDCTDDRHSKKILTSLLELLLNYSQRFYDRQFATREKDNKDILVRFENLIDDYFVSGKAMDIGTPTVSWCASQLCLSPNYFGDLIKKETGRTAIDYIQQKTMTRAKELLMHPERSISEISFMLGYQYPQYFTRAFKKVVGCTPNVFRRMKS